MAQDEVVVMRSEHRMRWSLPEGKVAAEDACAGWLLLKAIALAFEGEALGSQPEVLVSACTYLPPVSCSSCQRGGIERPW